MTGFWGAGLGFGENRGPVGELNVQMFSSATVCVHAHSVSGNSSGLGKAGRGSHLLTGRRHAENNRESQGTPEVTLIRLINLIDL